MVTVNQVVNGASAFASAEIIPQLSGARRFGAALYVQLAAQNASQAIPEYLSTPAVHILGVSGPDGLIDIDRLHDAAVSTMRDDHITIELPVIGSLTFSRTDVDKLCSYIRQA